MMDVNGANATENLQRLWQSVYFSKDDSNFDDVAKGAKQADAYRSLIFQLHHAKVSKRLSSPFWEHFVEEFEHKYSQVVDDQSGLNNFAEGALSLAAHRKNESSSWKSTLSELPSGKLMEFLPVGTSLQEDIDDSELQELIDVLNTENKVLSVVTSGLTFPTNAVLETVFPRPAFYGNERQNLYTAQVPMPSNSLANNSGLVMETCKPLNSSIVPQAKLFSSASSSERHELHTGSFHKRKHSSSESACDQSSGSSAFRTAKEQLAVEQQKKQNRTATYDSGPNKKFLGSRRGLNSKFISPVLSKQDEDRGPPLDYDGMDSRLKNIDPKMIEMITNEIMDDVPQVSWDDIAGLDFAKSTINEIVVWPMLRPDLFRGLRGPPKGILLFGPPGTGKTMIGKCIASQSRSTFFSISASSLTSKWIGDGEKMVRALFAVARCHQPAVVFIDEIDSLLSQRSESEHESSRRLKTEFLVQLDGATTCNDERLLIVGATNRPQELDEAARRRLVKRLYIPLPECTARKQIITNLLSKDRQQLSEDDLEIVCKETHGYSGADMTNLCKEASLGPIRSIKCKDIEHISTDQVRPIEIQDFLDALKQVRASVSEKDLETYLDWNRQYGCLSILQ